MEVGNNDETNNSRPGLGHNGPSNRRRRRCRRHSPAAAQAPAQNGGPPAPDSAQAVNGPNPGAAVVSWTAVPSATHYRVGWVAYADYNAATAAGTNWLEAFTFVDLANRGQTTHQITRLTPGIDYAFIVGSSAGRYAAPTWSAWASLTLSAAPGAAECPTAPAPPPANGATPTPTPTPAANINYDRDDDGLIEIATLAQLDVIRHDLDGDGVSAHADYAAAFPNAMDGMGCLGPCSGYELTADLDFDTNGNGRPDAGDAYWDGGAGWLPIGDPETEFRYNTVFDGGGHTIANLFIYWTDGSHAGLFRATGADAEIRNVRLTNVRVLGQDWVGALVGSNDGSISHSSADGRASGKGGIGGLVGYNSGNISHSKAVVTVEGSGNSIGGLVGSNPGTIADSHAGGAVTGEGHNVGGLVGSGYREAYRDICGAISGSYATGAVTGEGYNVGGLVGKSGCGTIRGSYATGNVTGEGDRVGGLAGDTEGAITASYATGNVTGEGDRVGGLAGDTEGAITASYATGNVSGDYRVGGLAGDTEGAITASYATGTVSAEGRYYVGGLVGYNAGSSVVHSYWDTQTSGVSSGRHGIGKTTRELQAPTGPTGIYSTWNADWWDFGTRRQYPALKYEGMDVAAQRP